MSRLPEGLRNYLRTPFVVIVWFMETYTKNRARMKAFMAEDGAKKMFQGAIMLTVVVWVVVGLSASPEDRNRLTNALMGFWDDTEALAEEKKRRDALKDLGLDPPNTETAQ